MIRLPHGLATRAICATIRYRAGAIAGYASRLHYFCTTGWPTTSGAGHVTVITPAAGEATPDLRAPSTFMTGHAASYPRPPRTVATLATIQPRGRAGSMPAPCAMSFPKVRLPVVVNGIRDGDIIAAAGHGGRARREAHPASPIWKGQPASPHARAAAHRARRWNCRRYRSPSG